MGEISFPLKITFRNMEPSPAVEDKVRKAAAKLGEFSSRIVGCEALVEVDHRRHRQGGVFHVRVDLKVPGAEIAVSRDPELDHAHEDVFVAIRDAFDAARRRLQDHERKAGGAVKVHEETPHGRVARLFPEEGFGFLETSDGRELYFHRNSVLEGKFERMKPGDPVRFSEELGERGPQASTVHPLG